MFGLKTCDFTAKNASSSKETANHIMREGGGCAGVSVRSRKCTLSCICDYRKFTECITEIYKAKPAESIISYITTPESQMTVRRPGAVQPHVPSGSRERFHIFSVSVRQPLLGIGTVPNFAKKT